MKYFLLTLIIPILVGCTQEPIWNNTLYVDNNGTQDIYLYADEIPYLLLTSDYTNYYYFPLLKDNNLIAIWYDESLTSLVMYIDDNGNILSNAANGFSYTGQYKWLNTNALYVGYTHVNGELLDDPFPQVIIFSKVNECKYDISTFTFGLMVESTVYKCELKNG